MLEYLLKPRGLLLAGLTSLVLSGCTLYGGIPSDAGNERANSNSNGSYDAGSLDASGVDVPVIPHDAGGLDAGNSGYDADGEDAFYYGWSLRQWFSFCGGSGRSGVVEGV